jgi:hypothetical protein
MTTKRKPAKPPRAAKRKTKPSAPKLPENRSQPRLTKLTAIKKDWRSPFIKALGTCGNITWAATAAGISRQTAYEHKGNDPQFSAAWDEAIDLAVCHLEVEARRRAVEGILKPVFHGGEKVGSIREYSDTLLIFLLKAANPAKYRDGRVVIAGDPASPLKHEHTISVTERIANLTEVFMQAVDREEGKGPHEDAEGG